MSGIQLSSSFGSRSARTWGGVLVFLKDPDAIPSVLAIYVRAQFIPRTRGPHENVKGEGEPLCKPRKAYIIYLWVVLHLTDQQPVPVY